MSKPVVGKILDINIDYNRDAIHVPIVSAIATELLDPGARITLKKTGDILYASKSEGSMYVVDPFLKHLVEVGEKFYCWVKPGIVHKLWHDWKHMGIDG